ncbi:MAG: flagellar basal body P-ring formation protein FlgA [Ignavibacteriales bacterium]|nr:flagellar basal body P-ring formation protein FlgA [Ignavibacteriales bacterium]
MRTLFLILISFVFGEGKNFDSQLIAYLDKKLSNYTKYEFQIMQSFKKFAKIEINTEKKFKIVKNYGYLPVTLYDKDNNASSSLLTIKLKLFKNVLVALQAINRNEELMNSMFTEKNIDISLLTGKPIDPAENILDHRSRMFMKEGDILQKEMIEPVPLVFKGDNIVLHAGKNGVDITVDCIARQEGRIGDVISIQSVNKLYKAKIIDKYNLMLVE